MSKFKLHRTAGNNESGDYELRFGDETKESWSDVTREEANENAEAYISEEVMGFGPPEARAAFKQVPIHIPFSGEIDQS